MYEDGEDTTKAKYIAKMEDIRFIAGPIIQRHLEKVEAEVSAVRRAEEEVRARKRAAMDARKKAETDAKKPAEPKDAEMKDATPANGDTPMEEVE